MQNWVSHLDHFQSILQEFDEEGALEESDLIWFFHEDFKPLIEAQIEQWRREHDSWEEFVKKAFDAKAKASLQLPSILCEMDQRCSHVNRPAHFTMAMSQSSFIWDPYDNAIKKRSPLLILKPSNSSSTGSSKTSDKKTRRGKKKHRHLDQQRDQGRKDTSSTPITGANSKIRKYMFKITCFNCNIKGNYLRDCFKSRKNDSKN